MEEVLGDLMRRDGIGIADVRRAVAAGLMGFVSPRAATEELRGIEPALELPATGADIPAG